MKRVTASPNLVGLRVGIDARTFVNPGVGVSRYVSSLLDQLIDAGVDVTLVKDSHPVRLDPQHIKLPIVNLDEWRQFRWEQVALKKHLIESNYDVYLAANNTGLPLTYRGETVLALLIHDLIPILFWRHYLLKNPRWGLRYFLAQMIAVRRADSLFTISTSSQKIIRRFTSRRAIIAQPSVRSLVATTPARTATVPYFVYVGGYDWRKNASKLVEAFATLRSRLQTPIQLVMTGNATPDVSNCIERFGLKDDVVLTGIVSDDEKWALLQGAIATVYPSKYEGFGLPLIEAFSAGIPVISSEKGALGEVGGDAIIRVNPNSQRDIASKMELCFDENFRALRIRSGHARLAELQKSAGPNPIIETFGRLSRAPSTIQSLK